MSDVVLKLINSLSPEQRRSLMRLLERTGGDRAPAPHAGAIAVIGVGCRFPGGANGPAEYWDLLSRGVDAISEIPRDRWDAEEFTAPGADGSSRSGARWGGFLRDIDQFDPDFFSINRREADWMDPQQRIVLEVAWEALEDAGQVPRELAGSRTGVFIGVSANEYMQLCLSDFHQVEGYTMSGVSHALVANRLSYFLDLRGPSVALDTACSSSLTAIHLACQSLLTGDSDLAIAGGVNLILSPAGILGFSDLGGVARDGRCKPFDARADGMVRSEGCGVIVLRRLADARARRDPIRALIRATAANQDGRSTRLTAPNPAAQQDVIRQALKRAGVDASQVSYVEAHGTGTSLGDPIEVEAIAAVYGKPQAGGAECLLGSVKANLGHLESAAGVAGLIKAVLSLENGAIPGQIHFRSLNPNISLDDTRLVVPDALRPWTRREGSRMAGVSSFGFGGSNAHVILEESSAELQAEPAPPRDIYVLPISAQSADSLRRLAAAYVDFLQAPASPSFADVCHTASVRRAHHDHRLAVIARTPAEAAANLSSWSGGGASPAVASGQVTSQRRPGAVFVFPGWGSQWPGMGRWLFAHEPVFRQEFERCAEAIAPYFERFSVLDIMPAPQAGQPEPEWGFAQTQAATFAIGAALTALWRSWGVEPDCAVGHSMGEVTAAYAAGVLSLEDAARVICRRSQLLEQKVPAGAMALVGLGLEETRELIEGYAGALFIAVSSSPQSTVISGAIRAVDEIVAELEADGDVFCRRIKGNLIVAHSPMVEPAREELVKALKDIKPRPGSIPFYSTVTGGLLGGAACDAAYWGRNLREPVLFADATRSLLDAGNGYFIEVSAHPILLPSIEESLRHCRRKAVTVPTMRRDAPERDVMLSSIAGLYAAGHEVNWAKLYEKGRCVPVPRYAWHHRRCWIDAPKRRLEAPRIDGASLPLWPASHPLLGPSERQPSAGAGASTWEVAIGAGTLPSLADHKVQGLVLFPGAGYLELALTAAHRALGAPACALESVRFVEALSLTAAEADLQIAVAPDGSGGASFRISSSPRGATAQERRWTLHAEGVARAAPAQLAEAVSMEAIRARCTRKLSGPDHYARAEVAGIHYGPAFQGIKEIWCRDGEALGLVELPAALAGEAAGFCVHPALLDACIQAASGTASAAEIEQGAASSLPSEVSGLRFHARPGSRIWSHVVLRDTSGEPDVTDVDIRVLAEDGRVLLAVERLRSRRVERRRAGPAWADWLYNIRWQLQPLSQQASLPAPAGGGRGDERWLILGDRRGVGDRLAARLRAAGQRCLIAYPGEGYEVVGPDSVRLDLERRDVIEAFLREQVTPRGAACSGVIHLAALDASPAEETSLAALADDQRRGLLTALSLTQALAAPGAASAITPPRLWLITAGAQPVEPGPIAVAQAPLIGLGRSIPWEHPELRCTRVDLSARPGDDEIAALYEEVTRGDREDEIALRGTKRHVARLGRTLLPAEQEDRPMLHADATYLITGGLGGLGGKIATWMVEKGARHLVLMARTGAGARLTDEIAAMEQVGARVEIAQADVSSEAEVAAVLRRIAGSMPPLRGIVHAAGVLADALLENIDATSLLAVAAPKIFGAWNLHVLTRSLPLDFFALFSSSASLLGSGGQSNYAAASAFLDALAHHRRASGKPALSVNWGPWSQVGLAARAEDLKRFRAQGVGSIGPEDGVAAFEALLRSGAAQAGVIPFNRSLLHGSAAQIASFSLFADFVRTDEAAAAHAPAQGGVREHLRGVAEEARAELLAAHIARQIAPILSLSYEELSHDKPLVRYGLDSLMAVRMKNALEMSLGVSVLVAKLFQGMTILQLAEDLLAQMFEGTDAYGRTTRGAQAENDRRMETRKRGGDRLKELRQRRGRADR